LCNCMIEQLDIVVRSNLPSRHRRLVRCLIGWFATVLLIALANGTAALGRGVLPDDLLIWVLWFGQFGWLLLLYLYAATIYHTGKLIMPCAYASVRIGKTRRTRWRGTKRSRICRGCWR